MGNINFHCEFPGQEGPSQENGEVSPEADFVPRKCDIITIAGRAEKCELAKAALLVGTFFSFFFSFFFFGYLRLSYRFPK